MAMSMAMTMASMSFVFRLFDLFNCLAMKSSHILSPPHKRAAKVVSSSVSAQWRQCLPRNFVDRPHDRWSWLFAMYVRVHLFLLNPCVITWPILYYGAQFSIGPALRSGRFMVLMCPYVCMFVPIYFFPPYIGGSNLKISSL